MRSFLFAWLLLVACLTTWAQSTVPGATISPAAAPAQSEYPPTGAPANQQETALTALRSLCDPAKLATLGGRGANPRLKKIVYWLQCAREAGRDPAEVIDQVLQQDGYPSSHAALIKTNLLRNIKIGDELGFFTPENLGLLRCGEAPLVMRGPYAGDRGEVDHIIPFSVAPEIGNDLSNLELMPGILNRKKSGKVGQRQKALARDLATAGVIDQVVLNRILDVATSAGPSLNVTSPASDISDASTAGIGVSRTVVSNPTTPANDAAATSTIEVWVNTRSHIYHMPGTYWYGKTEEGKYLTEADAIKEGDRRSRNGQ